MRYRLLGPLQVVGADGAPISMAAPKRRALLAVLLLHANQPVTIGALAEALWGPSVPPAAVSSLRAHVSRLRRETGAPVSTGIHGYLLEVGAGELDAHEFEHLTAAARQQARSGDLAHASATYREALDLWHGPALADFSDEEFAQAAIRRLEELRTSALEELVEVDLGLGRHADLVGELESLVAEHPLRERLWGQLMRALYRSGRQADALAAYRRVRLKLADELGIDPSPELQELEMRVLHQDPELAGPFAGPRQPPVKLPVPLTGLTGRQDLLAQATELLGRHRLVTLTGPGGVGKTRLALAVAKELIDDNPDGVLFVDLSGTREPSAVIAGIGAVTGGGDRPAAVIGSRQMMLVLDNFEQVITAANRVSKLAEACPNLRLLVTSRVPLRIRGEQQLDVPPLRGRDAAALFEERGRAALYTSAMTSAEAEEIVARLDGLPLAIELAAARLRAMSPSALRQGLRQRLPLLTSGRRDGPQRHRTLRETIAWSYELLDADAQAAFRACGVFPSEFNLSAAMAVADADLEIISDLVEHSLLRRTGERYAMLDTIREFAAAEADAHGEQSAMRDAHLAHYVAVARSVGREEPADGPMVENPWLVMCRTERENFQAALTWADEAGDHRAVYELLTGVGIFWLLTGAETIGEQWMQAGLDAVDSLDPMSQAVLLSIVSEFPRYGGDGARALELKRRGLAVARSIRHPIMVATLLDDLASVLAAQGEFVEAHGCLDEAFPIRQDQAEADPIGVPHTLFAMAELALREGNVLEARKLVAAMTDAESTIDRHPDLVVESSWLVARTLLAAGQLSDAADALRAVIRDAGELTMLWPMIDGLIALACVAADAVPAEAARLLGMADRVQAESLFAPWDPGERDRTIGQLRDRLGEAEFDRLRAAGHALPIPAIVAAASTVETSAPVEAAT